MECAEFNTYIEILERERDAAKDRGRRLMQKRMYGLKYSSRNVFTGNWKWRENSWLCTWYYMKLTSVCVYESITSKSLYAGVIFPLI